MRNNPQATGGASMGISTGTSAGDEPQSDSLHPQFHTPQIAGAARASQRRRGNRRKAAAKARTRRRRSHR